MTYLALLLACAIGMWLDHRRCRRDVRRAYREGFDAGGRQMAELLIPLTLERGGRASDDRPN